MTSWVDDSGLIPSFKSNMAILSLYDSYSETDGGKDASEPRGFRFGALVDDALSFGMDFERREFRLKR